MSRSKPIIGTMVLILAAVMLMGCGLEGKVFVGFFWEGDGTNITTFTCGAPNIPSGISNVEKGRYYVTLPGTYSLTYQFALQPAVSVNLSLETIATPLGQENAYYNVTVRENAPPVIERYP